MNLTYGDVCTGIGAATVAWGPLGWKPAWFAEIEPQPSAILAHHYPAVPNMGDMTILPSYVRAGLLPAPDILVGGTPCQAFSVAGVRAGLLDPRGQLTLSFADLANAIDEQRPGDECVIYWENVPGVLSDKTNAFGCFLAILAGEDSELVAPGGKWPNAGLVVGPQRAIAWRVLGAQYFGVAQRRRRVFLVASAREGFDPGKLLFESDGVRRDTAPSRQAGQGFAAGTLRSTDGGCFDSGRPENRGTAAQAFGGGKNCNPTDVSTAITAHPGGRLDLETETFLVQRAVCVTGDVTHCLKAEGFDASEDGTGRGQPIVAVPSVLQQLQTIWRVRRLTPRECERLQGFPDDYTLVPLPLKGRQTRVRYMADGPRYKALGNSMAVPCMRWLGERLIVVDARVTSSYHSPIDNQLTIIK